MNSGSGKVSLAKNVSHLTERKRCILQKVKLPGWAMKTTSPSQTFWSAAHCSASIAKLGKRTHEAKQSSVLTTSNRVALRRNSRKTKSGDEGGGNLCKNESPDQQPAGSTSPETPREPSRSGYKDRRKTRNRYLYQIRKCSTVAVTYL